MVESAPRQLFRYDPACRGRLGLSPSEPMGAVRRAGAAANGEWVGSRRGIFISLGLAWLVVATACGHGVEEVTVEFDPIHQLTARLFLPSGRGPHAAVVLLHGGCFLHGSHRGMEREGRFLAEQGFAALSIDYRLANQGGQFPRAVGDVKCAVRWLKTRAGEFGVDPARIAVLGTSAGGYLASITAATPGRPEFDRPECGAQGHDASVAAAVVYYGVSDWNRRCRGGMLQCEEMFLSERCDPQQLAPVFDQASVTTYRDEIVAPYLLLHGELDGEIGVDQSRQLRDAMGQAGGDVELLVLPGVGHNFERDWDAPAARRARRAIVDFLDQRLERP
ncbi:alpha/beta hydrolase [Myxococcota bacterium]|nr:alpha/beta hydrolase [Myxococcota bacterium]